MASRLHSGVLETPQFTHCLEVVVDGEEDADDEDVEDGLGNMEAGADVGEEDPRL